MNMDGSILIFNAGEINLKDLFLQDGSVASAKIIMVSRSNN